MQSPKDMINPEFPLFIPSKGRYNTNLTANYLDIMKVPYRLVVEPQEYDLYLEKIKDKNKIIILDMTYKEKYNYCDEYGTTKGTGSGPARNFIWDTAVNEGYKYHWIMDDNIIMVRYLNQWKILYCDIKMFIWQDHIIAFSTQEN